MAKNKKGKQKQPEEQKHEKQQEPIPEPMPVPTPVPIFDATDENDGGDPMGLGGGERSCTLSVVTRVLKQ